MEEIWKVIEAYNKRYMVSNLGRVKRIDFIYRKTDYILKNRLENGYNIVHLSYNKKSRWEKVHRLIAIAFIPNPWNKPYINHINGNRSDNSIDNLEWCTQSENVQHAWNTGLCKRRLGEKNTASKLKNDDVLEIFNHKGHRFEMMNKYNINFAQYYHIKSGRSWSHLTGKAFLK